MSSEPFSGRPSVGQAVLKFLRSVGRPSEAELYLSLFRSLPRGRFALLVPTDAVLNEASGTLAEQLAFLQELGLHPSVVLGAVEPVDPVLEGYLMSALSEAGVAAEVVPLGERDDWSRAEHVFAESHLPVLRCENTGTDHLAQLAAAMKPRKVIVLRDDGGLGPHEPGRLELSPGHVLLTRQSGIFAVNLRSDLAALAVDPSLTADDRLWLARAERWLEAGAADGVNPTTVSFASPLSLLRELFTVRGEGTLVKLGSVILRCSSYAEADRARIEQLLVESFERPVKKTFWERRPARFYVEQAYRGMALLEPGARGATYLSKFAVLPLARGEGLGQDLWWEMRKDTPMLYWRSRPDNPINGFYLSACDGVHKTPDWHVYWCGVLPEVVPELVADAIARPVDLKS
jgi:hypothetical protein